jgi:hypothetical protein
MSLNLESTWLQKKVVIIYKREDIEIFIFFRGHILVKQSIYLTLWINKPVLIVCVPTGEE